MHGAGPLLVGGHDLAVGLPSRVDDTDQLRCRRRADGDPGHIVDQKGGGAVVAATKGKRKASAQVGRELSREGVSAGQDDLGPIAA